MPSSSLFIPRFFFSLSNYSFHAALFSLIFFLVQKEFLVVFLQCVLLRTPALPNILQRPCALFLCILLVVGDLRRAALFRFRHFAKWAEALTFRHFAEVLQLIFGSPLSLRRHRAFSAGCRGGRKHSADGNEVLMTACGHNAEGLLFLGLGLRNHGHGLHEPVAVDSLEAGATFDVPGLDERALLPKKVMWEQL